MRMIRGDGGDVSPEKMQILGDMVSNPQEFLRIMDATVSKQASGDISTRVANALEALVQPGLAGAVSAQSDEGP